MSFSALTEAIAINSFQKVRLVATDMDGTLTHQGKFTSNVVQALESLATANIPVLIITGRSAGWVQAISSYLPVTGAIAENGGLYYTTCLDQPDYLTPINDLNQHRLQLKQTFQFLQSYFPFLQESTDNNFRLTDWTFDVQGLSDQQLQQLANFCQSQGWSFTYSTVQCHIKPLKQDKATALLTVLERYFPQFSNREVVTIGDSPNDQSLFNSAYFPISVGVANITHYEQQLSYQPSYITQAPEGEGFCELAGFLRNSIVNQF